jgi:hypothetical protein
MNSETPAYNQAIIEVDICDTLVNSFNMQLKGAENKIWRALPVRFLDGNPIVGYSKQKKGIRLMFWSKADFVEDKLGIRGGKFKDASIFYNLILLSNG